MFIPTHSLLSFSSLFYDLNNPFFSTFYIFYYQTSPVFFLLFLSLSLSLFSFFFSLRPLFLLIVSLSGFLSLSLSFYLGHCTLLPSLSLCLCVCYNTYLIFSFSIFPPSFNFFVSLPFSLSKPTCPSVFTEFLFSNFSLPVFPLSLYLYSIFYFRSIFDKKRHFFFVFFLQTVHVIIIYLAPRH
jgi:hypothetical protein